MSFVGNIQGMYYDTEKRKYFKIQANAPANSAYSATDVKRRYLEDERTKAIAEEKARQQGRIRRFIRSPLTGGLLSREAGIVRNLDGPRIFAGGLVSECYFREELGSPFDLIFIVHQRLDLGPSMVEVRTLHHGRLSTMRINADCDSQDNRQLPFESPFYDEVLGRYGLSTSLTMHEARQKIVATWLAGTPNTGIAIVPIQTDNSHAPPSPNIILGPGRSRGSEVDVYSSTAAPESSPNIFAIGTSEGILTIDKQNFDAHFLSRNLFPPEHSKDVFALEFLSNDPSILLSGGRSGILNVTDLRVPDFGQQADIIKHQSSITHIKQVNAHRIIVAGLESSLCQYDLRFRKGPKRTQAVLRYPDYQNSASIRIGFDIDLDSGVVAAAQEHDIFHPHVQLFSLHGGHALRSEASRIGREGEFVRVSAGLEVVPCVRFAQDVEGKMKSLYIAADVIRKYGWG